MTAIYEPLGCKGARIQQGDLVVLLEAPSELLDGLDPDDAIAIQAAVGTRLKVEEFDQYGHAELMFRDANNIIHFFWLNPKYLQRQI